VRGTAHEYVWLERAPAPLSTAAAATAAADLGPCLGEEVEPAGNAAAPGPEAAGGHAEPGGHCQAVTAWCVMDAKSEVRIYGFDLALVLSS
jgi:hypothetical protein